MQPSVSFLVAFHARTSSSRHVLAGVVVTPQREAQHIGTAGQLRARTFLADGGQNPMLLAHERSPKTV